MGWVRAFRTRVLTDSMVILFGRNRICSISSKPNKEIRLSHYISVIGTFSAVAILLIVAVVA